MSLWTNHKRRWQNCKLCPLHLTRTHVVLARGSIPAEIMLAGEGPGASEDILGSPFQGPAGKLLDKIMVQAGFFVTDHDLLPVRFAMSNLVACLPLGDDGNKTAEPSKESIEACAPRLIEFIRMCEPKVIVCVGGLSEKWLPKILERGGIEPRPKLVSILHPAFVLRTNIAGRSLLIQRMVVTLADVLAELDEERNNEIRQ